MPAPAALTTALTNLLYLDGRTMPDSPDRDALFAYVAASRWLRFALGVGTDEPMPRDDDAGVAAAAGDFGKRWQTWMAYRRSMIEVSPPGGAPVRFRVSKGAASGTTISDTVVVSGFDGTARVFVTLGTAVDTSAIDAFLAGTQTAVTFHVVATPPPQLASVTPTTFAAGDTVTLRGSNFNATPAGNTALFGTARGRIVSSDNVARACA